MHDKTCLSYWFPRLTRVGLPVPMTAIVAIQGGLESLLDGEEPWYYDNFIKRLTLAVESIGVPCFLRTGHGSGKHDWKRTCYLTDLGRLKWHVSRLVEWSVMVETRLPTNVWAVRELLPTNPIGVCERYGDMPVCREFRCFVDGGDVRCIHGYWPLEALEEGGFVAKFPERWYERFNTPTDAERAELTELAGRAGAALDGKWSVDLLETDRGWYVIDCAEAESLTRSSKAVRKSK